MSLERYESLRKKYRDVVAEASRARPKTMFSIGPLSLNLAIGNPHGVPAGRFIQLFGMPSVGKSTVALDIVRQWQDRAAENDALYVDFERGFDMQYAANTGVDLDRLIMVRADTTEQGMNVIEAAVREGIKLVVVDSIAAGMPSTELEKGYDDNPKMASNAGLWTRFVNRMIPLIDNNDTLIVLLNQMRKNFSMMSREENIPYGGVALKHASSLDIALSRIKQEDTRITVQALAKKNKVGNPLRRAEFFIEYGRGIRHDLDILTLALDAGIVSRSGAWYSYDGQRAQGLEGAASTFDIGTLRSAVLGEHERVMQHMEQTEGEESHE